MLMPDLVRGAGGGGGKKGGSGSGSNSNSIRSRARARMVELLGEGPIKGLKKGAQSIFFDQTPLQNADGTFNFKGVNWEQRFGYADQQHFTGTAGVETPVQVEVQVKNATGPVQRTIVDQDADAVRVIVRIPALFNQNKSKGGMDPYDVSYAFDIRHIGGQWNEILRNDIRKEVSTSPFQIAHRLELPATGGPWDLRLRRISDDPADETEHQNQTWWEGYVVITDGKFIYPHSAAVFLDVNAEDAGSNVPPRAFEIDGLIVQVPSNYDPFTGTYSGIWNGTFKNEWTCNPAWIFYDLLTNNRYGLGEFIDAAKIDKWSLYTIAQYCDQQIPSGFKDEHGVDIMERRFTYNGVINSRDEAYAVLQQVSAAWRGMAYWSLGQVFATADIPADPVKLVSPSNVIGGEFNYSGTALKSRHSVVVVTWNNPDDFYRPAKEVVIDEVALQKFGWREKTVNLNGCTSRGLAHRYGKWILDVEQNETETVEFVASWDHAELKPGEIVAVSDPSKAKVRTAGRIRSHIGNVVTLDAPVELTAGATYQLLLTLPDGTVQKRAIRNAFGTTDTLTVDPFSQSALTDAMFTITGSDIAPRSYRVITVAEPEANQFKVTALFHDPTKYARVEQGIYLAPPTYSRPKNLSFPPSNLRVSENTYTLNGTTRTNVTLSWTPNQDTPAKKFRVYMLTPDRGTVSLGETEINTIVLTDAAAGLYAFYVQGINWVGLASDPVSIDYEVIGVVGFPLPTVSNLALTDGSGNNFRGRDVSITWDNNFASSTDPVSGQFIRSNAPSPHFKCNIVKVYEAGSNKLLRTQVVTGRPYVYTFEQNRADSVAQGLSGASRALRFEVMVEDVFSRVSAPVSAVFTNPTPLPVIPTHMINSGTIYFNFPIPEDNDWLGLLVFREMTPGVTPDPENPFFDTGSTAFSIPGQSDTSYYFRFAVYDLFGKDGMLISQEIEIRTFATVDMDPPAVPTGLVVSSEIVGDRAKAVFTWAGGNEEDLLGFDLEVKTGNGNYISYPTNGITFEILGLLPSTQLTARVRSRDRMGNVSNFTAPVSHTTLKDTQAPATPTGLKVQAGFSEFWITLNANVESDLSHYEFYESDTNAAPAANAVASFQSASPVIARTGLSTAVTKHYWVRAVDTSGNKSAWSARVQSTTAGLTTASIQSLIDATSFKAGPIAIPQLSVIDLFGNTVFGADGKVGKDAYINVGGNNVLISDVASNSLVPSIHFVGEKVSAPTQAQLGADWRQNAVYKNSTDGVSYILTGTPLAWAPYLSDGKMYAVTIESTNGGVFRVGQNRSTTLKARVFKNGAEITDDVPDTWFRWRRVSAIPQPSPNDDASWNALYQAGYKQLNINVDSVYARATFFIDIISQ